MKITIANKKLTAKPKSDIEKGRYFENIKFRSGNFKINNFKDIVDNGCTITYLYKDVTFDRANHYMKNNYYGTEFIVVDIDKSNKSPKDFVKNIKNKPTFVHTTFSNLTPEKDNKYCFHLIYCFSDVIEGEDNFTIVFNKLTEDYTEYVDKNAKDCHRVIFTSNKELPNYEFIEYGNVYNVNDFVQKEGIKNYDDIDSFFNDNQECVKIKSLDISITHNNISQNSKITQNQSTEVKHLKNDFNLDSDFFNDLNSLDRQTFVYKYSITYPYITETQIDRNMFVDGYADVRFEDYYVVPTAQYSWNVKEGKAQIRKIQNGHRTTMLWLDAIAFMKIIPNITKEHLVYLLVAEAYKHFMNGDGQLNNWFIVSKAKEVWNNIDNLNLQPVKKTFVIDKCYWLERGYNNWLEVSRLIRQRMKANDFGSMYDFSMTVEDNIEEFKKYGVKTTKKTLIKWLEENGYNYVTKKEYRNSMIMYFYNEDKTRSCREIEKLCKDNNIKVCFKTISDVINRNK